MNIYFSLYVNVVRLNLFNHVLALFCAKFACNSAIRSSAFRWELCKGCVWESMKNWSSMCIQEHSRDWNLQLTHEWWLTRSVTRVEHARNWRVMTAGSLQDKKYNLAIMLVGDWNLRLILVVSHSPKPPILQKNDFSHSLSYPTINTLIPTKCRELLERILRDKP